jgi:hypothetical protein
MKGSQKEVLNGKFHNVISYLSCIEKTSKKTKIKMGVRHPEGHTTDPRNMRREETSRRQRRMEASSEGGQGPEWVVGP